MIQDEIMKLQTYKMFEGEDTVYVERDDVLEVLKKEPCEDCVSRKAVLEQTYNWSKDEFLRVTNPFHYLRKRIDSLPPVTPKGVTVTDFADKCRECGREKVLDKIKEEIESECCITVGRENDGAITLHDVFEIIDKYKAESEDKE